MTIPSTFSLLDDPIGALDIVGTLVQSAAHQKMTHLVIDHLKLKTYDLAAEAILDLVVEEIRRESFGRIKPIQFSGKYPADQNALRFIAGKGLPWRLKVNTSAQVAQIFNQLNIFERRTKTEYAQERRIGSMTPKERDVHDFVKFFDRCLGEVGRQLTGQGRQEVGVYLSEILDNVVEHSGGVEWIVEGYLDSNDPARTCEISIANLGITIAESLLTLPSDHFTRKQVDPYIETHQKRGFFGSQWKADDLYTLAALQGGVSSQNENQAGTRGNGTIDLIQFFQDVHAESNALHANCRVEMVMLSGSTFIKFDGTHQMHKEHGHFTIAFNKTNDLNDQPDPNCIYNLGKRYFPGTIISIRFPLRDTQLEASV